MGRERSWNGFNVNQAQTTGTKSGGGGGGRHPDFSFRHNGISFKLMRRLATMLPLTFVNLEKRGL
jgi:hypothetical protein